MKTVSVIALSLFVLAAGILLVTAKASADNTQVFTPARFALVSANINVSAVQSGGIPGAANNQQSVMLKLDTVTGNASVLQLTVAAANNPTVLSAVWAPIQNVGQYSVNGN